MENKTLALDALVIAIIIIGGVLIYRTLPSTAKPITLTTTPMQEDKIANSPTEDTNTSAVVGATGAPAAAPAPQAAPEPTPQIAVVDGVKIQIVKEGSGKPAQKGDSIAVSYTGMLTDGKVFDSSIPRGQPIMLVLGSGQVIKGWEVGILGMRVGEQRQLTIPGNMAYGETGYPGVIPPNATLIFDVELIAIK